jgi:hypothetical protein
MAITDIENKIKELKIKQSEFFKKKKAERNPEIINTIRQEMNDLKAKARATYRKESPAQEEA